MADGGLGGSGVGLSDVLTVLKNGVVALNNVAAKLAAIFPQSGTTAITATTGTNGAPPAQVAGYLNVTINGQAVKVPYYNV